MCLAVPGRIAEIFEENGLKMGTVDYSGTLSKVCLEYVPEITVGQYTVVHAGFAISIIDEDEARKSLETWRELLDAVAKRDGTDIFGKPLDGGKGLSAED